MKRKENKKIEISVFHDYEGGVREIENIIKKEYGPEWKLLDIWRDEKGKWQILIDKGDKKLKRKKKGGEFLTRNS